MSTLQHVGKIAASRVELADGVAPFVAHELERRVDVGKVG